MHTTDTVDYGIVLEGEVWLELDDGQQIHLHPHDVVVQNGTRHAWRNRSDKPVRMAFVLIGARRGA
jgi:quercetin dioxygenase-like cupin family protein